MTIEKAWTRWMTCYEYSGLTLAGCKPSSTPPACLRWGGDVGVPAWSDETTAGRALGGAGRAGRGGAADWVRPRFPRLIRQPVNTQQEEGAEGRRPDGRRRGKPEPRPSCRKWGLMWKHPVQRGLDWWPAVIAPSTAEASSAPTGGGLGARPRTWFTTSPKDVITGSHEGLFYHLALRVGRGSGWGGVISGPSHPHPPIEKPSRGVLRELVTFAGRSWLSPCL